MKLKLGTKVLWINSFSIGVYIFLNYLVAIWFVSLFGTTISDANPLWFMELIPHVSWVVVLFLIGVIWNQIPSSERV